MFSVLFYFTLFSGTGKTMLMDMFYSHVENSRKKRVHFNSFMLDIHRSKRSLSLVTFLEVSALDKARSIYFPTLVCPDSLRNCPRDAYVRVKLLLYSVLLGGGGWW